MKRPVMCILDEERFCDCCNSCGEDFDDSESCDYMGESNE